MSDAPAAPPPSASDEPVDNRLFVLILQHPQERREGLATAAATCAALRRAALVVGLSWPNLARVAGRNADPRRWAVLYLGSARPAADRTGIIVTDGSPADAAALRRLDGVVLLDGSWREAKTLWWRNPWLLGLHRLVLNPAQPSRYGALRREPRREALSTLEAAALVLRHGGDTNAAGALDTALERLLAAHPPLSAKRRKAGSRPRRRH